MLMDNIQFRPFQKRGLTAWTVLKTKIQHGHLLTPKERALVAHVFPGSGKTRLILSVLNDAWRKGLIDGALILVPRLILAKQMELDWRDICDKFAIPRMGEIVYRENNTPLLRQDEFGLVTTYQSLVSQPEIFRDLVQTKTFALVADEAQFLGYDPEKGGTRAAELFQEMAQYTQFSLIVSGTPYRSDDIPLVFGRYATLPDTGNKSLLADVEAGYIEGVRECYLRPFEYRFQDAEITWESLLSGDQVMLNLSSASQGLYDVLTDQTFYAPLIDMTIEKVIELHSIWSSYCGLIGCADQKHARDVQRYIRATYPQINVLLAISDEPASKDNLSKFKQGGYQILITVGMVFIGYDHKPISVVCSLSPIRDDGWNRQFFARGLRMANIGDERDEMQCLYAIVPDDPAMRKFVENMRNESERGLQEAKSKASRNGLGMQSRTINAAIISNIHTTTSHVMGLDPSLDLNNEEAHRIDLARKAAKLTVPLGALKAFMQNMDFAAAELTTTPAPMSQTKSEIEHRLRSQLAKLARRCDAKQQKPWGYTHGVIKRKFGKKPETENELKDAIQWLRQTYKL